MRNLPALLPAILTALALVCAWLAPANAITVKQYTEMKRSAGNTAAGKKAHEAYLGGVRDALIVYNLEVGRLTEGEHKRFCVPEKRELRIDELAFIIDGELKRNAKLIRKYPKLDIALVALVALAEAYPCKKKKKEPIKQYDPAEANK